MATNPKLPDFPTPPPRKPVDSHGRVQIIRKGKFPWPLITLIVAAAIMVAIIAILPRGPKTTMTPTGAQAPPQPTGSQVRFTDLQMVPSPAGGAMYLNAVLHNAGTTSITGVQVSAAFMGQDGALKSVTAPIQDMPGTKNVQDLTRDPIKPNESRPVTMYVDRPPNGWNHQPPQLTVEQVTATTPK